MRGSTTTGESRLVSVTSRGVRGRSRSAIAVALLLLAPTARAGGPAATPPAPPAQTAEQKAAIARIRTRVGEWATARAGLVIECFACMGRGYHVAIIGGSTVRTECSRCAGAAKTLSPDVGRKLLYDMRTPAWRLRETSRDDAGNEFKSWRLADGWKLGPKAWRIAFVDLIDPAHAVVGVVDGKDSVARDWRWVLAADPMTKRTDWYLWTEGADGPWPERAAGVPPAAPGVGAPPAPPLQRDAINAAIEKVGPTASVVSAGVEGGALFVTLDYALNQKGLDEATQRDSIGIMRALFAMPDGWTSVRLTYRAWWQDRFGAREAAPVWVVSLDGPTARKIHWQNLSPGESWALLSSTREDREGWNLLAR